MSRSRMIAAPETGPDRLARYSRTSSARPTAGDVLDMTDLPCECLGYETLLACKVWMPWPVIGCAVGMTSVTEPHTVRAPRGTTISCKGWQQEAALRMLMNNLD